MQFLVKIRIGLFWLLAVAVSFFSLSVLTVHMCRCLRASWSTLEQQQLAFLSADFLCCTLLPFCLCLQKTTEMFLTDEKEGMLFVLLHCFAPPLSRSLWANWANGSAQWWDTTWRATSVHPHVCFILADQLWCHMMSGYLSGRVPACNTL